MTQEQLAEAADVNLRTVQRVERGLPCSQKTVQALANAMSLDEQHQSEIWSTWEKSQNSPFSSGFFAGFWRLLPSLPGAVFVLLNLGYYELGLNFLEPVMQSAIWGAMISHPFAYVVLLVGPLLSLTLCVPKVIQVRARSMPGAAILEGLVIKSHAMSWLTMILAISVLAILSLYVIAENIGDLLAR
jgi:DNA-binding XRE family transcriptional regulator